MYHQYHSHSHHRPIHRRHNHGITGLFGSLIGLTTATLRGGTHIARTIVEGSVWHSGYGGCDTQCHMNSCTCHRLPHCYHIESLPHSADHCC